MIELNRYIKSDIYLKQDRLNNLPLFLFSGLSKYQNVLHFITTRQGGYSKTPFHAFNLAFHVGDKEENVFRNRAKLAKYLNIPLQSFTISNQVHGTNISIVGQAERGSGATNISTALKENDAMITNQEDICLLIFVADCVPVFLYDKEKKVIGLIHAGWKGTIDLITEKTVSLLQSYWDCKPQDIICAIGPSIGPCCYQVGPEVVDKVRKTFPKNDYLVQVMSKDGRGYFNLWETNKIQLLDCNIPEKNIEVAELCTCCHSDIFFSSRKEHRYTGRFAAGIMLKKSQKVL